MALELNNYLAGDANLQGYWRLESDGTDTSSNSYNLTENNTPAYVAGKFGNGVDLTASSSESLSIANASCPNLEIAGNQSWVMWVKPETSTGTAGLMSKRAGGAIKQLLLLSDNTLRWRTDGLSTATHDSTATCDDGVWSFVVCTFDNDNDTKSIWINNVEEENTSITGTMTDTNGVFYIGDAGGNFFDGMMDDVAVFDRVLTDVEISKLYLGGPGSQAVWF